MRRIPLLLALALLLPTAGCEVAPEVPTTRTLLADRLPEARVVDRRVGERSPPARARDGLLVQRGGSTVTFALPLPPGAQLSGGARVQVPGGGAAEGALRIRLRGEDGAARTLVEAPLADGSRVAIAADLSDEAGPLAALDLAVDGPSGGPPPIVTWEALSLLGSAAPAETQAAAIPRGRYDVLVILLDSLRADHIAPYDAAVTTTPHLARLARQGVTFTAARSPSSWTQPAVASLLTSRPPWGHGVLELGHVLPDALPYLPELLSEAGWRTVGISGTAMFSSVYGFNRGFPQIKPLWRVPEVAALEGPEQRADWVWSQLLEPVARMVKPFFVYLHELDPHSPYEPPEAYTSAAARDYAGRRPPSHDDAIARIRGARHEYRDAEIGWLNQVYRGEVAAMDAYVGRLLGHLDASGRGRNTLVVFTADHGEEFDDHRSVGHGHTVYEELVRVPLLLRLPGVLPAGVRHDETVDLLDVAPTVLDLLGLPVPEAMQGRSLLPLLAGGRLAPRAALSRSEEPAQHGVAWGRWKLLRDGDGGLRLYDLADDPGEHRDVLTEHPVVGEALRQMLARRLRLETVRTRVGRQATEDLAPDEREQLRELGYIE